MPRLCSLWVRLVRKLRGRKVKYLVRVIQVVRDGFDCEQFDAKALTLTWIYFLVHIKDPSYITKQRHGQITSCMDFIFPCLTIAIHLFNK